MRSLLRKRAWKCCSIAKDRNVLLRVVVLEDVAYSSDRMQVLVSLHIQVVERGPICRGTIAEGEVYRDAQLYFAPAKHVLEEGVPLVEIQLLKPDCLVLSLGQSVFELIFLELGQVTGNIAEVFVLAGLLGLKEFQPNFALRVLIRHLRSQHRH